MIHSQNTQTSISSTPIKINLLFHSQLIFIFGSPSFSPSMRRRLIPIRVKPTLLQDPVECSPNRIRTSKCPGFCGCIGSKSALDSSHYSCLMNREMASNWRRGAHRGAFTRCAISRGKMHLNSHISVWCLNGGG